MKETLPSRRRGLNPIAVGIAVASLFGSVLHTPDASAAKKSAGKVTSKATKAPATPRTLADWYTMYNSLPFPKSQNVINGGADQNSRRMSIAKKVTDLGAPMNARWGFINVGASINEPANPFVISIMPDCSDDHYMQRGTPSSIRARLELLNNPKTPQAFELYFRTRQTIKGQEVAGDWHRATVRDSATSQYPDITDMNIAIAPEIIKANVYNEIKSTNLDIGISNITTLVESTGISSSGYEPSPALIPPQEIMGSVVVGLEVDCQASMRIANKQNNSPIDEAVGLVAGNYEPNRFPITFPPKINLSTSVSPYNYSPL